MGRDRDWLHPCMVLVAAQWAVAFLIAWSVDFVRAPPLLDTFRVASLVALVVAPLMVLGGIQGRITIASIRTAIELQAPKAMAVYAGVVIGTFQMALLTWCKLMLPIYSGGFWADPFLAELDAVLVGTEPWLLTRALRLDGLLDLLYFVWIPLIISAMLALFASPPSRNRTRAIIAFFLLFAFGSFSQFLAPSAGPIFYDLAGWGDRFAALLTGAPETTYIAREWLWKYHSEATVQVFIGISAMPSMHVAGAAWLALVCRALWPWLFWPALLFFVAIFYGSVFFGLHYVCDGIVGTAAALGIWGALGRLRTSQSEGRLVWERMGPRS